MNRQIIVGVAMMLFLGLLITSCKEESKSEPVDETVSEEQPPRKKVSIPPFQADSAFAHIEKQLSFGPRNPNSTGHEQCKQWISETIAQWADDTILQDFKAQTYRGEQFKATNIIGVFNPDAKKRIVLAAHWDTRFIADFDPDDSRQEDPIPGADDGGSGVGVLLEIARNLHNNPIEIGVDIIFFDAEDQGDNGGRNAESWCLGAQHWARNPHTPNYSAEFGILLDMVGSKGARFTLEGFSMQFAPQITNQMWNLAQSMGFSGYFIKTRTNPITDDHYFVNTIAKIPMTNIVNKPEGSETGFGWYWHTHSDDIEVINKATLKAVGQVVLATIYRTNNGNFL